jgi:hypothetical protein
MKLVRLVGVVVEACYSGNWFYSQTWRTSPSWILVRSKVKLQDCKSEKIRKLRDLTSLTRVLGFLLYLLDVGAETQDFGKNMKEENK